MNITALAKNLRTGGWDRHARRIGALLLEHGMPYDRTLSGRTIRVSLEADGLAAHAKRGDAWQLVADERACYLPIERVSITSRESMRALNVRVPDGLSNRLTQTCKRTGRNKSEAVRQAIANYLDALE
jgi:hypothetical protein